VSAPNDPRSKYLAKQRWAAWNAGADRTLALDSSSEGLRIMRSFYEKGLASRVAPTPPARENGRQRTGDARMIRTGDVDAEDACLRLRRHLDRLIKC